MKDLGADGADAEDRSQKSAPHKRSLFVADALSNPRHVQFAIKVTLAGMLGYFTMIVSWLAGRGAVNPQRSASRLRSKLWP